MLEHVSQENITLAITIFIALWQVGKSVLRTVSPTTQNTLDDRILGFMESAEKKASALEESAWVKENGPSFWAQVEALSKTQIQALKGPAKLAQFLGLLHSAYVEATGKGLTLGGTRQAQVIAAGLSSAAKIGNPPAAPLSK
jgi:hypothetical protein